MVGEGVAIKQMIANHLKFLGRSFDKHQGQKTALSPISGTARSLAEAKAAAVREAGVSGPVNWKDIGPELT